MPSSESIIFLRQYVSIDPCKYIVVIPPKTHYLYKDPKDLREKDVKKDYKGNKGDKGDKGDKGVYSNDYKGNVGNHNISKNIPKKDYMHKLAVGDNAWSKVKHSVKRDIEKDITFMRSILNKMTLLKCDKFVKDIQDENIDCQVDSIVQLIFEKILSEPKNISIYLTFCSKIYDLEIFSKLCLLKFKESQDFNVCILIAHLYTRNILDMNSFQEDVIDILQTIDVEETLDISEKNAMTICILISEIINSHHNERKLELTNNPSKSCKGCNNKCKLHYFNYISLDCFDEAINTLFLLKDVYSSRCKFKIMDTKDLKIEYSKNTKY